MGCRPAASPTRAVGGDEGPGPFGDEDHRLETSIRRRAESGERSVEGDLCRCESALCRFESALRRFDGAEGREPCIAAAGDNTGRAELCFILHFNSSTVGSAYLDIAITR